MGASRHAVASWEAAPAPTNALTTRESISNKRSHVVAKKKMMPRGERNNRALSFVTAIENFLCPRWLDAPTNHLL